MVFVVSLSLADAPFGGRFDLQINFLSIRVHLCPSVVKTAFDGIVPARRKSTLIKYEINGDYTVVIQRDTRHTLKIKGETLFPTQNDSDVYCIY
jgi:hypothetical protein